MNAYAPPAQLPGAADIGGEALDGAELEAVEAEGRGRHRPAQARDDCGGAGTPGSMRSTEPSAR